MPKADHTSTAEETAEQERIEQERERNRLRYQQRKTSEYYDKAKKAKSKHPALPMAANQ